MADEEPRKVGYDTPLSAEVLFQLINSSIQSGNPLWLQRANLYMADLRGATLYNAKLSGARYDADTKWPEGFDPEPTGAALVEHP